MYERIRRVSLFMVVLHDNLCLPIARDHLEMVLFWVAASFEAFNYEIRSGAKLVRGKMAGNCSKEI